MAARSIASLTLSFGLVSIPVKLYSATETSSAVKFNLLAKDGSRLKQQYVSEKDQTVVPRSEMVKGYEFEKDRFVLFSAEELKALEEASSPAIEIMAFIPEKSVDPLFYDKAYLIAPDKRGGKPYALLAEAMRKSGRCALAKWAWKAKQYVVQVRPVEDGLVLQQLLYADEVRSLKDLNIEPVAVSAGELQLALQLIDQISAGRLRPDAVRRRREEAHPRRDRREDRRQAGCGLGARRSAGVGPGHRPDGSAARQPGQEDGGARSRWSWSRPPRRRPKPRNARAPSGCARRGTKAEEAAEAPAPAHARARK